MRVQTRILGGDVNAFRARRRQRRRRIWSGLELAPALEVDHTRTGQALFDKVVTDWERMRYFERG